MHESTAAPLLARLSLLAALAAFALPARAQTDRAEEPGTDERRLVVEPAELVLDVGSKAKLEAKVVGADGAELESEFVYFSRARRSVTVTSEGEVEALAPGEYTIVVRTRRQSAGEGQASRERADDDDDDGGDEPEPRPERRLSTRIHVTIHRLPLQSVDLSAPDALYTGTVVDLTAVPRDTRGVAQEVAVSLASSAPDVASFDAFGRLHLHAPGRFTATAECEGLRSELALESVPNPVASLSVVADQDQARTGDVVRFTVHAADRFGTPVHDVPVEVAVGARPDDQNAPPASGQVRRDERSPGVWRFVAEKPGLYTLVATCGDRVARAGLRVTERKYDTKIELLGRGTVNEVHTSDLWVWEGVDGRDYAVTGTWGGDGEALFWDVTDPTSIERIATVKVDARTVNDVKVSADGRLCVISREGASNRKNGIVMIDVTDPHEPVVEGEYSEGLTGGVHNVFVDGNLVYALSNGRRYDIIDVTDRSAPRTIGKYELDTPGHSIHDVWVEDGLAYSSNWSDGVHIVDVGNGIRGGSPENPVYVGHYAYPSGWNHAAFPYHNEKTGRFYVVAGDEAFPYGLNLTEKPTYARGWLHFIDFTDVENPVEVARYEVPEAGTHNFWIEDDVAYVAYYNGGLRVVDISGELMGDLYAQGREMDFFLPDDPEGFVANAPMVWGPQPHKGNVFFSDWNSGLWAVKVVQETGE